MEDNKDLSILENPLLKFEDSDAEGLKVANARTRPNANGLYGEKSLSADEVKKMFDKYPEKLRERLNKVIEFTNALLSLVEKNAEADGAEFSEIKADVQEKYEDLCSSLTTLYGRISKFESERGVTKVDYDNKNEGITFTFADGTSTAIDLPVVSKNFAAVLNANLKAGEGIVLSYDETAKEVTVSAMGGGSGGGTTVKVSGEAVSEFDADTKLDKLISEIGNSVYISKADGSTMLMRLGTNAGQIPSRTTGGHIVLPTTGLIYDYIAVPKKYVDDKIGDIQSALEELHTYAQSLIGGNEE